MDDFRLTNAGLATERDANGTAHSARKSSGSNSSEWLVNVEDDVVVPMITSEIVEAFRAGRVTRSSLVWRIGMHDWSTLAEVPQLRLAVGPSALPSAISAPGHTPHDRLAAAPDQARPDPLPFGFAAAREPASVRPPVGLGVSKPASATPRPNGAASVVIDIEAIAVYERPAPSLAFGESLEHEWQGRASSRALGVAPAHLTPVPRVASPLALRASHRALPNTLAPTTSEPEFGASALSLAAYGDKSVVFASELRAVKKTSLRLALWAALGSAVVASVATFWIAHSPARPADQVQAAPPVVATQSAPIARLPSPESAPTTASAAPASVASGPPVVAAKPAPARAHNHAKRVAVAAPPSDAVGSASAAATSVDNSDEVKPSVAGTPLLGAPHAGATSSAAAPVAAPLSNALRVAPTPGF